MAQQRRGRWPVVAVNGAVATTVLILVAVLALVVQPPAPPGIAAFAPQAAKPITKAPPGQSSQFGAGDGQCTAGQVCTGKRSPAPSGATALPTVSPPALSGAAPAGLQCFSWPDGSVTQTFDPQSPPCVSRWDDSKGNGGATSPGVTGTTIRVALPVNGTKPTWPTLRPLVDFVNTHFQFYGRQIQVVPFTSQQATSDYTGGFNKPEMQSADAKQITQMKVFGTFDFVDPLHYSWSLPEFISPLVKAKIVSINGGEMVPYGTASGLAAQAPYVWTYYPPIDSLMSTVATVICRQLVGKPAIHAPDASMRTKTRKFAIVAPDDARLGGGLPGLSTMRRILDSCGIRNPTVIRTTTDRNQSAAASASLNQLRIDGVTSIIYFPFGGDGTPGSPQFLASGQNYTPEWVVIGWYNYLTAFMLNNPPSETSGSFGVGVWNKIPDPAAEMWEQAFLAGGGSPTDLNGGLLTDGRAFYHELLLLASGIQAAGPRLTPDSFAAGLRSTTFPNPGAGTGPTYQATVGFPAGSPAMVQDYEEFWLDTRMTGAEVTNDTNNNETRATCYVAVGRRWFPDAWPTTDDFYGKTPCR